MLKCNHRGVASTAGGSKLQASAVSNTSTSVHQISQFKVGDFDARNFYVGGEFHNFPELCVSVLLRPWPTCWDSGWVRNSEHRAFGSLNGSVTVDTEIEVRLTPPKCLFAFAFVLILLIFHIQVHIDTSPYIDTSPRILLLLSFS